MNVLVRLLGWRATILHGDVTVVDRWRWLRRHLRPGPVRTLDAGCGAGAFTLYAAMQGNRATGVSFDQAQLARARSRATLLGIGGVDFTQGDLRELDRFGPGLGQFDQILLFECIEHIRDDAKLVSDLAARLEPGGTILLTTPYAHHRPLWGETVSAEEDGGHVRFGYTHEEIARLFDANGIDVIVQEFLCGVVSQALASLQFALCRIHPHLAWAAVFPLRMFHPLDGILTRWTGYPCLAIGIVGRKRTT